VTEDPRRAIVEVMAKLGRETQFHIDERHRHFQITDAVIIALSLVLVILAIFNVYYVTVLYKDLRGTVSNMEAMYTKLRDVDDDMKVITKHFASFDVHMQRMTPINTDVGSLANMLPEVRGHMDSIAGEMTTIQGEMDLVRQAMGNMDQTLKAMGSGVLIMRSNAWQLAQPMGMMNSILP